MGFSPTPQPQPYYSNGSKRDPSTTEIIIICSLSIGLPLLCLLCYLLQKRIDKWRSNRRAAQNAPPVSAAPVTTQHTIEMPVIYAATMTSFGGERDVIAR